MVVILIRNVCWRTRSLWARARTHHRALHVARVTDKWLTDHDVTPSQTDD